MASPEYEAMASRAKARDPFTGKEKVAKTDVDASVVWRATKATVRFVTDVLVVLLPVVLFVNSGILPAAALAPFEAAVAAITSSPVEPVRGNYRDVVFSQFMLVVNIQTLWVLMPIEN